MGYFWKKFCFIGTIKLIVMKKKIEAKEIVLKKIRR